MKLNLNAIGFLVAVLVVAFLLKQDRDDIKELKRMQEARPEGVATAKDGTVYESATGELWVYSNSMGGWKHLGIAKTTNSLGLTIFIQERDTDKNLIDEFVVGQDGTVWKRGPDKGWHRYIEQEKQDDIGKVVMEHWLEGGTGICNFYKSERAKYQAAIDANGDTNIMIVEHPIPGKGGILNDSMIAGSHSLHHIGKIKNLERFWRTMERIKEKP